MMECKKFLTAANGDIELAILEMRKAGQAKADKKSDRIAAEGVVVVARSADNRQAVLLEINSETDFVARDNNFTDFANQVAETALNAGIDSIDALSNAVMMGRTETVEQARQALIAKIGENIQLRRLELVQSEGVVGSYLHGSRIGVLVVMGQGSVSLAKDLAMHVAANRPLVVRPDQVSPELVAKEREIFMAQAAESGKPAAIIEKMVDGRITKFMDEVCLLSQPFVKDPNKRVEQLLKEQQADVIQFIRYEVGEGIEKKEENFVEEVMAQVRDK